MKPLTIKLRVRVAWWARPYIYLTCFGMWLGLPISREVVARDLCRAIRLEVVK